MRNRTPDPNEIALELGWLDKILVLMRPRRIVAVGLTAAGILPSGTKVVRHPANGGSRQLRADLARLAEDLRHQPGP